jgi:hypothetical protein
MKALALFALIGVASAQTPQPQIFHCMIGGPADADQCVSEIFSLNIGRCTQNPQKTLHWVLAGRYTLMLDWTCGGQSGTNAPVGYSDQAPSCPGNSRPLLSGRELSCSCTTGTWRGKECS